MSKKTALSRIIGTLHRLRACTTAPYFRFRGAYELMIVYEAQGYTPLLFATALSHIGHKFSETLWLAIARFIYDIRSTP